MRVLFCGDRNWTNKELIMNELVQLPPYTIIIEGEARGADKLSRECAALIGFPVERYPADWDKYGKAAGAIRNRQMLDEGKPDLVIAFHNNIETSKGTKNMITIAQKASISTKIIKEEK